MIDRERERERKREKERGERERERERESIISTNHTVVIDLDLVFLYWLHR